MNGKRFIIITGGVISGIGKGTTAASLGRMLKEQGLKVGVLKIDPYLNIDAGTMNPDQHGEVFVTDDGYEADLDLGHYERFLGENMSAKNNLTAGQTYFSVIENERKGKYLGSTVQIIPHLTREIKDRITNVEGDVIIVEIGGTVGDIEGEVFLEAIRELKLELPRNSVFFIHLTFVPYLSVTSEFKTKPTQQSVQLLRRIGIQPDMIIARSNRKLDEKAKNKIALFSGIRPAYVIGLEDLPSIYQAPERLFLEGAHFKIGGYIGLDMKNEFKWNIPKCDKKVSIALIGKYTGTDDAYKSVIESLILSEAPKPDIVDSEIFERDDDERVNAVLEKYDGLIIPGGFGSRGIEGKIKAIKYAREHDIPLLGLCLGMQLMVVEYARNCLNLEDANSTEFDEDTSYPVIDMMEEQKRILKMGGTMRLGSQEARLIKGTVLYDIYGRDKISERHRHRYEINLDILPQLKTADSDPEPSNMRISAISQFVEAVEISDKRFFVGVQYHPEYKSKVGSPHPLFKRFVEVCANKS